MQSAFRKEARSLRSGRALHRSDPLRSRLRLVTSPADHISGPFDARLNAGLTRNSRVARATLPWAFSRASACSRALRGREHRALTLVTGRTRERSGSLLCSAQPEQRERAFVRNADCVKRLFFGDFLLAPQKKVTRPPGRDPAWAWPHNQPHAAKASASPHNQTQGQLPIAP